MIDEKMDHPPLKDEAFTPVTTSLCCNPKGTWFKINWRWGMSRKVDENNTYMFRENLERLHHQIGVLLEATSNGKILESGTLDPLVAAAQDAAHRRRLEANKNTKVTKGKKALETVKKTDEKPVEILNGQPSGVAKAKQLEIEIEKEEANE